MKPDLIVGNTLPKNSSYSNWHGCYCAYLFVIVVVDKKELNTKKQKKNIERKTTGVIKDLKRKKRKKKTIKMRTPNVWLYFNMIIQG